MGQNFALMFVSYDLEIDLGFDLSSKVHVLLNENGPYKLTD